MHSLFSNPDEGMSPRCEELAHFNGWTVTLAAFIAVGILVSYLPQHYRLIRLRSSKGISPWFVLLGTISGTSALANVLTLPTSREDVRCCREISSGACAAGLLGIAQVAIQWTCFFVIMLLFLIFFPREESYANIYVSTAEDSLDEDDEDSAPPLTHDYKLAVTVVAACIGHMLFIFFISGLLFAVNRDALYPWASFLGVTASILAMTQYLPQIWTTYQLKQVKSLSLRMMWIQTPGSFVFALSLGLRFGAAGWSAWSVYIVTGILQGTLLVMGTIYEIRVHRRRKHKLSQQNDGVIAHSNGNGRSPSERSPLLSGNN